MDTKSLHYNKTITKWDDALPLGNGDIGCLIWNRANKLRFTLDKGGIWDCSDPPENQENFTYEDMKRLVAEKNEKMLQEKYDDCYNKPTPTKLPAGKIILNLGTRKNIISDLDFNSAEANLKTGNITVKSFVHANENYGLIEINKTGVKLKIDNPKFGKIKKHTIKFSSKGTTQSLKNLKYPDAEFFSETKNSINFTYFIQPTNDNRFYGIIAAKAEQNGKTLIAYTVNMGNNRNFVEESKKIVTDAIKKGYEKAFAEHKIWWAEYWQKSSISIPDKILEKGWYINNYLLASCSRKNHFPMPLQGVWTADNGSLPPWKGDYHHDLNTQMSYTSYLKANRLEEGESFIDYLLDMADSGRRFAKSFYNTNGLCLPSVMDIEGHALGGWCQYALSPTNQLWLCQIMARYYYFTKDEKYLEKIYAYMTEVGKFLLGILEEKNGVYRLPLSTSPEIHDNSIKAWLTPNTNYDLALMHAFAEDMITLSKEVGNASAAEWQNHLKKFEPLAVDENGVLMLDPNTSPFTSHRHHSHCMSIYPLKTLEYTTPENKRIIDCTIKDLEKHGRSAWVGYSLGWMAELYIAKGEAEKAQKMLQDFFNYTCTKNGFHANGDFKRKIEFSMKYRLFTLEGNFIATDAVQDMLLYSEHGKIKLFPAVPNDWNYAEFNDFRAYGGLIISAKMKNKNVSYLKIKAEADCSFVLENNLTHLSPTFSNSIHMKKGEEMILQ